MKITAVPFSRFTGKTHTIFDSKLSRVEFNEDGSVQFQVTSGELQLHGTFNLKLAFTSDEIAELYRSSLAGAVNGKLSARQKPN